MTGFIKNIRYKLKFNLEHLEWENEFQAPKPPSLIQVVLTHDVDWSSCWDSINKVLTWEEDFGLRSCNNFLTKGSYAYNIQYVQDRILGAGHEVGLHGQWHDPALAYRSRKTVLRVIQNSIDELGIHPVLFRSPSCSSSPVLMAVLDELNIPADSSFPAWSPYYNSSGWPAPYKYPGHRLVEIPLVLQDDFLFREARLTDKEAVDFTLDLFMYLQGIGGCLTLNTHPGIIIKHEIFYKSILEKFLALEATIEKITNVVKLLQNEKH